MQKSEETNLDFNTDFWLKIMRFAVWTSRQLFINVSYEIVWNYKGYMMTTRCLVDIVKEAVLQNCTEMVIIGKLQIQQFHRRTVHRMDGWWCSGRASYSYMADNYLNPVFKNVFKTSTCQKHMNTFK